MEKIEERPEKKEEENGKNPLEWTVFGLSLLLIVCLVAYLVIHATGHKDTPPDLLVTGVRDSSEYQILRYFVTVENRGNETAADVLVKVKLRREGAVFDEGEILFPFIPEASVRSGWYQFSEQPAPGDSVRVQVVSYREP